MPSGTIWTLVGVFVLIIAIYVVIQIFANGSLGI